ncbi:LuxR family two component transcriptional regulator [Bifidobacterium sp. DSM 109959]|uniref:LuxR family two component transcriptional regulator n=2 Tax=Bifidobacterium olomucense TaxID=2675324 RepID=A0A7Y0EVF1_9BIFI|nr:LuxR family two component transcriptional regulator [Bifidobacterium sp. DSM 109959]
MRSSPTLLIMDNDRLALRLLSVSLRRLLPGYTVLAPVDTGAEAIAVCTSHHCPDLLLADVSMSDINGLVVCRTIRKESWKTSILMMTSFSVAEYAAEAVVSGAQGIIHKDNPKTIAAALLQIKETGICSDRFLNAHDSFLRLKSGKNKDLSPREIEIVDRWSRGKSMSDIAEELSISQTTVRTHLEHAASKLEVTNNRALISAWMHLNR